MLKTIQEVNGKLQLVTYCILLILCFYYLFSPVTQLFYPHEVLKTHCSS